MENNVSEDVVVEGVALQGEGIVSGRRVEDDRYEWPNFLDTRHLSVEVSDDCDLILQERRDHRGH